MKKLPTMDERKVLQEVSTLNYQIIIVNQEFFSGEEEDFYKCLASILIEDSLEKTD